MKYAIRITWYYIEVGYAKIMRKIGIRKSIKFIPVGHYCYTIDEDRNKTEPINGYWIKPCKYYRSMKHQMDAGCTYVGFIGFDPCLGDQCKMCGENY